MNDKNQKSNNSAALGRLATSCVGLRRQESERRVNYKKFDVRCETCKREDCDKDICNLSKSNKISKETKEEVIEKNHSLSDLNLQGQKEDLSSIPKIIIDCVEVIEANGIDEEGIYRISENVTVVQKMKHLYTKNPKKALIELREKSPNLAANLLKLYLRELPEPLLTYDLYPAFINSTELNEDLREQCICKFFNDLIPKSNKLILGFLLNHLLKIANNFVKNKMPLQNLATIFGPIFLRPQDEDDVKNILTQSTKQVSVVFLMLELFSKSRLVR